MKIQHYIKVVQKAASDHAPALLTGAGAVGLVGTAFLTGKASFEAAEVIREAQALEDLNEKSHPLELKEKAKLTWKLYVPAAGVGVGSIGCIIMSNRISSKRIAAVAAAYTITEKAYSEYKDKVEETFGKNKERKVRDDIAQDRVSAHPAERVYVARDGGEHLCYEKYMGHYTRSSVEGLNALRNEINEDLLQSDYVSLSSWYGPLGIPVTAASDTLGWRADGGLIELDISTVLSDDGEPCLAFDFRPQPRPGYDLAH